MFVVLLVMMLTTGDVQTGASKSTFRDELACSQFALGIEHKLEKDSDVAAFEIRCVEITKDDVKPGGASA